MEALVNRLCEFLSVPSTGEPATQLPVSSTPLDHRPDSPLTSLDGEDMDIDRLAAASAQEPPQAVTANPEPQVEQRASADPAGLEYMPRVNEPSPTDRASSAILPPIPEVVEEPVRTHQPYLHY